MESERGSNYIRNLHEVHAVFRRIKISFKEESSSSSSLEVAAKELEVKIEGVEKHWSAFKAALEAVEDGGDLPDFCLNGASPEVSYWKINQPNHKAIFSNKIYDANRTPICVLLS